METKNVGEPLEPQAVAERASGAPSENGNSCRRDFPRTSAAEPIGAGCGLEGMSFIPQPALNLTGFARLEVLRELCPVEIGVAAEWCWRWIGRVEVAGEEAGVA